MEELVWFQSFFRGECNTVRVELFVFSLYLFQSHCSLSVVIMLV